MICCGATREKKPWMVKIKEKEVKVKCSSIPNLQIDPYKGYLQGTALLDFMPNEADSKLSDSKQQNESSVMDKKSEPSVVFEEKNVEQKVFDSGILDVDGKDAPTAADEGKAVFQVKKGKIFADDLAGLAKQDDSKMEPSHLGISQGMLDSFIRQQAGDSESEEEYDDLGNAKKKKRKKKKDDDDGNDLQEYQDEMKKKSDPVAIYHEMLYADVINPVADPKANQVSLRNGNRDPRLYNDLNVKVGGKKDKANANEKYLYDDLK